MSKRKYGSVIFIIYYLLFLFLLFLFSFLFLFLFLFLILILILFLFLHIFYFYFFNYFDFFLNIIIYSFFFCHLPGMQHLEMMISHLIVGHYLAFQGNGYIQPKPIIVTTLYDKEKKCCII